MISTCEGGGGTEGWAASEARSRWGRAGEGRRGGEGQVRVGGAG